MHELQGVRIGVIHIPLQRRPFVLTRNFGGLLAGHLYYRRGTVNHDASPLDAYTLGIADARPPAPDIAVVAYDPETNLTIPTLNLTGVCMSPDGVDDLPDYGGGHMAGFYNQNYYRELAEYITIRRFCRPVCISVYNGADTLAAGVRLELAIPKSAGLYPVKTIPNRPTAQIGHSIPSMDFDRTTSIKEMAANWMIEIRVGSIQPKATIRLPQCFYLGATAGAGDVRGVCFGDNLPAPSPVAIAYVSETVERNAMTVDELDDYDPDADEAFA